jgi:hypothetical protein
VSKAEGRANTANAAKDNDVTAISPQIGDGQQHHDNCEQRPRAFTPTMGVVGQELTWRTHLDPAGACTGVTTASESLFSRNNCALVSTNGCLAWGTRSEPELRRARMPVTAQAG